MTEVEDFEGRLEAGGTEDGVEAGGVEEDGEVYSRYRVSKMKEKSHGREEEAILDVIIVEEGVSFIDSSEKIGIEVLLKNVLQKLDLIGLAERISSPCAQ